MVWTPSEHGRQEHGEDAGHGKSRWQEKTAGKSYERRLGDVENGFRYSRWESEDGGRLKSSVRELGAATFREVNVLH
jgi:hypothetical protein